MGAIGEGKGAAEIDPSSPATAVRNGWQPGTVLARSAFPAAQPTITLTLTRHARLVYTTVPTRWLLGRAIADSTDPCVRSVLACSRPINGRATLDGSTA